MLSILLTMLTEDEDRQKFLKLHDAYEMRLYQVALRILHSRTLAEDAVQQSWLQIIQHFEALRQIPWDELEGYLVVVAKNTALALLKKETRADPFPENWDTPAPSCPETDELARLVELIRAMPEKYREILEMRFLLEYSYQEIARRARLPLSTVSTKIARGRQMLVEKLMEEGFCYE